MYYKLKIPARLATFTFNEALGVLDEMRRSLSAQGEGKIPGFPSNGFETQNKKAIERIADMMKNDGGMDGRHLTREHLGLHMVCGFINIMNVKVLFLIIYRPKP